MKTPAVRGVKEMEMKRRNVGLSVKCKNSRTKVEGICAWGCCHFFGTFKIIFWRGGGVPIVDEYQMLGVVQHWRNC